LERLTVDRLGKVYAWLRRVNAPHRFTAEGGRLEYKPEGLRRKGEE